MPHTQTTPFIMIRGAGDLASGVALRLFRAGFTRLLLLECPRPLAVRRTVAFSEAVYEGLCHVEEVQGLCLGTAEAAFVTSAQGDQKTWQEALQEVQSYWQQGRMPVLVDPHSHSLKAWQPSIFIEATLRKVNTGLRKDMASLVLALGPGHSAPQDAHAIIESMRGHTLGRIIRNGSALPDTGLPGPVGGQTLPRLLRAPVAGTLRTVHTIGGIVHRGQAVGHMEDSDGLTIATVRAGLDGLIRGLLRDGTPVPAGCKIGDIDPRQDTDWHTVSEKALALGGGVLEAVCAWWLASGYTE